MYATICELLYSSTDLAVALNKDSDVFIYEVGDPNLQFQWDHVYTLGEHN